MRAHAWYDDYSELGERLQRCSWCGVCAHWPLGRESCGAVTAHYESRAETGKLGAEARWAKGRKRLTELRRKARELRAQGLSYVEIAQALGTTKQSARLWATRGGE